VGRPSSTMGSKTPSSTRMALHSSRMNSCRGALSPVLHDSVGMGNGDSRCFTGGILRSDCPAAPRETVFTSCRTLGDSVCVCLSYEGVNACAGIQKPWKVARCPSTGTGRPSGGTTPRSGSTPGSWRGWCTCGTSKAKICCAALVCGDGYCGRPFPPFSMVACHVGAGKRGTTSSPCTTSTTGSRSSASARPSQVDGQGSPLTLWWMARLWPAKRQRWAKLGKPDVHNCHWSWLAAMYI
jgi:hypothetical protein